MPGMSVFGGRHAALQFKIAGEVGQVGETGKSGGLADRQRLHAQQVFGAFQSGV